MVFITLWRSGLSECLLVLGETSIELRLIHAHLVVRRLSMTSSQHAVTTSAHWKHEWKPAAA